MRKEIMAFSNKQVEYIFDGNFSQLAAIFQRDKLVIVTDENVFKLHSSKS